MARTVTVTLDDDPNRQKKLQARAASYLKAITNPENIPASVWKAIIKLETEF